MEKSSFSKSDVVEDNDNDVVVAVFEILELFVVNVVVVVVVIVAILSPLALGEFEGFELLEDVTDVVVGWRIWTLKQMRLKCSHIWFTTDEP